MNKASPTAVYLVVRGLKLKEIYNRLLSVYGFSSSISKVKRHVAEFKCCQTWKTLYPIDVQKRKKTEKVLLKVLERKRKCEISEIMEQDNILHSNRIQQQRVIFVVH